MKNVFSLFLIVVATLSFVGAFAISNVLSTAGSPEYLAEKIVNEERVAAALTLLREQLESGVQSSGEEIGELTRMPEYEALATALFDAPWATAQLRQLLHSFDSWLGSNDSDPRMVVRLGEKKEELRTLYDRQLRNLFATLPSCQGIQTEDVSCRPDNVSYEEFTKALAEEGKTIDSVLGVVPDELDLMQLQPLTAQFGQNVESGGPNISKFREWLVRARELVRFFRLLVPILFLASALCVLAVLLIHRRSSRHVAAWAGAALLFPALSAFGIAVAVPDIAQRLLMQFAVSQVPIGLVSVLQDGIIQMARASVGTMRVVGGMTALLGLALLLSTFYERPHKGGPTIIRH